MLAPWPFFEAPGVLAIFAARDLLMPFLRRPSYCLSFLMLGPWSFAIAYLLCSRVGSGYPTELSAMLSFIGSGL